MALLPEHFWGTRLLIVGEGPQRAELRWLIHHLGLENTVSLTGQLDDRILSRILGAADLAVMPSVALEGFGLATLEALWHGTPVLATEIGANSELLRPLDSELVIPDSQPQTLATGIVRALERKSNWDPIRAHEYVRESFSMERAVARTSAIYEEVLSA
jgi:glycosyltransferase involved in cell wall biosynthesis